MSNFSVRLVLLVVSISLLLPATALAKTQRLVGVSGGGTATYKGSTTFHSYNDSSTIKFKLGPKPKFPVTPGAMNLVNGWFTATATESFWYQSLSEGAPAPETCTHSLVTKVDSTFGLIFNANGRIDGEFGYTPTSGRSIYTPEECSDVMTSGGITAHLKGFSMRGIGRWNKRSLPRQVTIRAKDQKWGPGDVGRISLTLTLNFR